MTPFLPHMYTHTIEYTVTTTQTHHYDLVDWLQEKRRQGYIYTWLEKINGRKEEFSVCLRRGIDD